MGNCNFKVLGILPTFLIFIVNKYCLFIGKGWPQNPVSLVVVLILVTTFSAVYFSTRRRSRALPQGQRPAQGDAEERAGARGSAWAVRGPRELRRGAQHSQTRPFVPESRGEPQLSNWIFTSLLGSIGGF